VRFYRVSEDRFFLCVSAEDMFDESDTSVFLRGTGVVSVEQVFR
jgi:hypothetical protein